jgi:hypothetical protein
LSQQPVNFRQQLGHEPLDIGANFAPAERFRARLPGARSRVAGRLAESGN